jgi:hypothetical protein
MKLIKKINVLLLATITFFSCDKLDELTEFDITEDFSTTLNVTVIEDSNGTAQTWTETSTINLETNEEIQTNLDVIQGVKINSLTFNVINFTGAEGATATEVSLSFGDTVIAVADINLEDSITVYSVGSSSELNTIANDLKNTSEITATSIGTVSSTQVRFDLVITLDVTTTIDVL